MIVRLISRPSFLGLPPELGTPRADQLRGPDAQKLVETAARVCYDSFGFGRDSDGHAEHILEVGHLSVLEHPSYSFFVSEVSRGETHEHVRHRIGVAISQRSTRYVDESSSPWMKHPLFVAEAGTPLDEAWNKAQVHCQAVYDQAVTELQGKLLAKGIDKFTARKQARGAARGILGNALATEMIWSANAHALLHFFDMRAAAPADAEIRAVAVAMLRIMQEELPVYFKDYKILPAPDGLGEISVNPTQAFRDVKKAMNLWQHMTDTQRVELTRLFGRAQEMEWKR